MSLDVLTCDELWAKLLAEGRVRWRLMRGMQIPAVGRVVAATAEGDLAIAYGISTRPVYAGDIDEAPDWNDPATLGCLRECARAALGAIHLDVRLVPAGYCEAISYEDRTGNGWDIYSVGQGATVAEALLRAIESAP